MGQWLSVPMIAAGVAMIAWSYRRGDKIDAKTQVPGESK
jgi:prolipoprotein diacylglyceryltransferase